MKAELSDTILRNCGIQTNQTSAEYGKQITEKEFLGLGNKCFKDAIDTVVDNEQKELFTALVEELFGVLYQYGVDLLNKGGCKFLCVLWKKILPIRFRYVQYVLN